MRILWATVAVLAIIAMHGVASHSAAPETATHASAAHSAHSSAEPAGSIAPEHGEHGHEASVLGLCLAMLASAGILLLRLARPRRGLLELLEHAARTASHPVAAAGGSPPPDLHALSILRC